MAIRYDAHQPKILVADMHGAILKRLEINDSNNNTGMATVFWQGRDENALLYNGGKLWDLDSESSIEIPVLSNPTPYGRMAWYHCIAADVYGDEREEVILYDPWYPHVYIFSPHPLDASAFGGYRLDPRQHNPRLMD